MVRKDYVRGILWALLWWALILAVLYAAARFAPKAWSMRPFILAMAVAWPLTAGSYAGWQDGKRGAGSGFAVALHGLAVPLLLLAGLWWWLFPQLWQATLYGKFALCAVIAALLSGGLGAGLAKARQALCPPRPEEDEEEDEDET